MASYQLESRKPAPSLEIKSWIICKTVFSGIHPCTEAAGQPMTLESEKGGCPQGRGWVCRKSRAESYRREATPPAGSSPQTPLDPQKKSQAQRGDPGSLPWGCRLRQGEARDRTCSPLRLSLANRSCKLPGKGQQACCLLLGQETGLAEAGATLMEGGGRGPA